MEAAGVIPAEIDMGLTEILLILLGVLAFVGSFIIPENLSKDSGKKIEIPEAEIKELIAQEVKQAAFQIEEKTEETVAAAAEKTERYMERLSNEKIMAIQEYSDTVLKQIDKNHEEAVFLYDMLNNKHIQVKNTAAEINNKMLDVKNNIEHSIQEQRSEVHTETEPVVVESVKKDSEASGAAQEKPKAKRASTKRKTPAKKTIAKKNNTEKEIRENKMQLEAENEIDSDAGSNKSKILKLHEEGKSNVEIAKSLGLGIGEVKLIIGLFENGE